MYGTKLNELKDIDERSSPHLSVYCWFQYDSALLPSGFSFLNNRFIQDPYIVF